MSDPVAIADQLAEAQRTVRERLHRYPDLISRGRLTAAVADRHIRDMRAVVATLTAVSVYADGLRALLRYLRAADLAPGETPCHEERAALLADPAVRAVVAAFPEAVISGVMPADYPSRHDPQPGDDGTTADEATP